MHWIRQRMKVVPFGDITYPKTVHLENGSVEIREVSQCVQTLPDVSTTDLGDLIDAGVNLQSVDSAIYGYRAGTVDTSAKIEETQTNNEGE